MITKLKELERKTKLNFYKKINHYYEENKITNFKFEQDSFSKNSQCISKTYHEVLLLVNFLQTKSQVKNMNIKLSDLYNTY